EPGLPERRLLDQMAGEVAGRTERAEIEQLSSRAERPAVKKVRPTKDLGSGGSDAIRSQTAPSHPAFSGQQGPSLDPSGGLFCFSFAGDSVPCTPFVFSGRVLHAAHVPINEREVAKRDESLL